MAGQINWKCYECARVDLFRKEKPSCYSPRQCPRRRSYYRNHEEKKIQMRMNFLKYQHQANECCLCHGKARLEVHHIEPRIGRDDRDELSNMLTLCHDCHETVEKYTKKVRVFYSLQESLATGKNVIFTNKTTERDFLE